MLVQHLVNPVHVGYVSRTWDSLYRRNSSSRYQSVIYSVTRQTAVQMAIAPVSSEVLKRIWVVARIIHSHVSWSQRKVLLLVQRRQGLCAWLVLPQHLIHASTPLMTVWPALYRDVLSVIVNVRRVFARYVHSKRFLLDFRCSDLTVSFRTVQSWSASDSSHATYSSHTPRTDST